MKTLFIAVLFILSLALSLPCHADMYKFIDEQGQERWTDDLSQVPEEQRSSAERVKSIPGTTANKGDSQPAENTPVAKPDADTVGSNTVSTDQASEMDRQSLEMEKADLDNQYQELIEERKQLEQIKAESTDSDTRSELNERILEYNRKTEAYESQLNAFNEKVKAYNQKILDNQSQSSE